MVDSFIMFSAVRVSTILDYVTVNNTSTTTTNNNNKNNTYY